MIPHERYKVKEAFEIAMTTKRTQEVDDFALNHLTFTNDYHRISIYTINTTSSRQIPDSPNQHHENYIANSKENY